MKKAVYFLTVIIFVLFCSSAQAAILQNSGFDSWSGNLPNNWTVSQEVHSAGNYGIASSNGFTYGNPPQQVTFNGLAANIYAGGSAEQGRWHEVTTFLSQRLSGATTNQLYAFSLDAWLTILDNPPLPQTSCWRGRSLQVGIDPYGETNPNSANIIWGPESRFWWNTQAYPFWPSAEQGSASVEAAALNSEITVFIRDYFKGETGIFFAGPHATDPVYGNIESHCYIDNTQITSIPEPASIFLLGTGLAVLFLRRKSSKN